MPKRALAQKRPLILASVVAALAWYYLDGGPYPGLLLLALKGLSMALLAAWLWLRHQSGEARLMACAFIAASLAGMAIELDVTIGGLLFFAYHLIALGLYLQHKRGDLSAPDKAIVTVLLLGPAVLGYILPGAAAGQRVGFYALALGAMAAGAWASTFPRALVGAGAVLFVLSDLVLFAQMGPLAASDLPRALVWPLYYLGQLLIATGIVRTLHKRDPQLRLVRSR